MIDVQINGAYGFDFSLWPPLGTENLSKHEQTDAYLAGLDKVAGKIVETGTTSFLPTIITQQQDLYREVGDSDYDKMKAANTNTNTPDYPATWTTLAGKLSAHPRLPCRRAIYSRIAKRSARAAVPPHSAAGVEVDRGSL